MIMTIRHPKARLAFLALLLMLVTACGGKQKIAIEGTLENGAG